MNLPIEVSFGASNKITYIYDAIGTKLEKKVIEINKNDIFTSYAGGHIYKKIGIGTEELQYFNHPEGYVEPDNGDWNYVYQYKDHLGNVRLSYADTNNDGTITQNEIIEEKNYYPFGLKHKGYNVNITSTNIALKKKFGGKEYQDELGLGWYDITARNYDPALGRWMNVDPLAELMRRHSPYNYAFNNPIYFMDYDGMAPSGPDQDDFYHTVHITGGTDGDAILGSSGGSIDSSDNEDDGSDDPPTLKSILSKLLAVIFSDNLENMKSKGKVSNENLDNIKSEKTMDLIRTVNQGFNNTFSAELSVNSRLSHNVTNLNIYNINATGTFRLLDGFSADGNFGFLGYNSSTVYGASYNGGLVGVSYYREYSNGQLINESGLIRGGPMFYQTISTTEKIKVSMGVGGEQIQTIFGFTISNSAKAQVNMELSNPTTN